MSSAIALIEGSANAASAAASAVVPLTHGGLVVVLAPTAFSWSAYLLANPIVVAGLLAGSVALGVGLLTFFGVLLSLRAATRRMRSELAESGNQAMRDREHTREQAARDREHASLEAHRERIATMRREVYLSAAAELVKAQLFLGGMAKQDATKVDAETGLGGLLTAVSRIAIVAEQQTVLKARSLIREYSKVFFNVLPMLLPMAGLKSVVEVQDAWYASSQAEIARIIAAMVRHNESMTNDPAAFAALQRSIAVQQEAAKRHSAESVSTKIKISELQTEYAQELTSNLRRASELLDELVCELRTELGLATDLEVFARQSAETRADMEAALRELRSKIALFTKQLNPGANT